MDNDGTSLPEDDTGASRPKRIRARRDFVTLAIAMAAIVLFLGTASTVLSMTVAAWQDRSPPPPVALINALLLNIALILLGWNRYKVLSAELQARRVSEAEARRLAEVDDLTGCLNRRSFTARLGEMLARDLSDERAYAAIVVDVDNFKLVNDINGHAAGDRVLVSVARRIQRVLPSGGILARLGGDEFVCVVPCHPKMQTRVDELATRIIDLVSTPVLHAGTSIDVTISIGIASSTQLQNPDGENRAERMMHKADIAMYHAKKQGKNCFYWFERPMENELRFRNDLETGIRRGIRNGEFVPYYEQQIDLQTGKLVGFEMLARWASPELGLVGPDMFIPIAEEIGVIGDLSESLIVQAFEDAKQWDPTITLSVNISPVQMRDPWFAQKLLKLLVTHRFPADRLDIEITESCLAENIGMVRSMITSLRNQGIHVSLDDFGTGYSSLSQLRSLPFDRLKIDRSFIAELREDGDSVKLVDAIISMSDGLKLPITAEGIENEYVHEALKRMGEMKGQGYHFGRPEPANLVYERLSKAGRLILPADGTATPISEADPTATEGKRAG